MSFDAELRFAYDLAFELGHHNPEQLLDDLDALQVLRWQGYLEVRGAERAAENKKAEGKQNRPKRTRR
jgi:hypothetical protein